jgi:predicted outer membrane repeat protein
VANVVTNCLFAGNSGIWGGAIFAGSNEILKVTNCTFANNTAIGGTAPLGGAIFCNGFLTLANNVVYGNVVGDENHQIVNSNGAIATLTANTNIIQNSLAGYTGTITYANDALTDAYDGNPLFIDATSGDFHLQSSSPAVDYGNGDLVPVGTTTDLDGKPRFFNDLVDLGCYEFQGLSGIESVNIADSFKAYFNSTRNNLIVDLKMPVKSIVLSDLTGKKIITKNVAGIEKNISIDVKNLSKGIYLLSAGNYTQKVIVY